MNSVQLPLFLYACTFCFSSLKHHERDEKVCIVTALEQQNQKGIHDFLFLFFAPKFAAS